MITSILLTISLWLPISQAQVTNAPRVSQQKIIFHTNMGNIVLGLFPEVAPQHFEQIIRLTKAGVYDGIEIFRIEPGFVAQIQNFNARKIPVPIEIQKTIRKLPAEFSPIPHERGILSMARFDDPNSAESSFSFVLGRAPHLDRNYTVIGRVLGGMDVVDAIERVPTTPDHHPVQEIKIVSAEVIGAPATTETTDPTFIRWAVCLLMLLIIGGGLISTLWEKK